MAADRALVDFVRENRVCFLRVYRWSTPTVSLGYFQTYSDFLSQVALSGLPVVRRETGGGAIVHHLELTYSLTMLESGRKGHHEGLYRLIHQAVVGCLQSFLPDIGMHEVAGTKNCGSDCGKDRFLCFERRSSQDIVTNGFKILGSAQKRYADVLSQHGSLLLEASPFAPHLLGLQDLMASRRLENRTPSRPMSHLGKIPISTEHVAQESWANLLLNAISDGLSNGLGVRWKSIVGDLRSQLPTLAKYEDQFGSTQWMHRR